MENKHLNKAADGIAEDLIRSIVQTGCAEVHAKTLYEKTLGELEEGIVDVDDPEVVGKHVAKLDELTEEINALAELRRKTMVCLYEMYEGDKTYWCQIKHIGIASYTLFEAYQASDDDKELLDLAMSANKAFIRALSHFLGVEITECAACFADMVKSKGETHG